MRLIRHTQLAAIVAGVLLAGMAAAEEGGSATRPTKAAVTSPGAQVRSGPGETFYLTDTLPEETVVEVYRRRPDGWCAIRPPADSFSWVFAQNVRELDDGLAEICKDDVAARVGSRLSAQRDVVQVRLKQGEKVAILGSDDGDSKPRDGKLRDGKPRDGGLWYKIAPPAGEFRWVQASDIGLASAKHEVAQAEEFDESENQVTTVALEEPVSGLSRGIAAPPLAPIETVPVSAAPAPAAPVPTALSGGTWSAAKSAPPAADITPIGPSTATSGNLAQQLSELELRLSRMVAESPTTWNIAPLDQSAELLLSRADTVADREAVKVTLAKIDRFAAIQRRYANANPTDAAGATNIGVANTAVASRVAADPKSPVTSPYDAVGILRPVVSRRPGAAIRAW